MGRALAAEKGIIVADTKFEFGMKDGKIILIDEVLTPDSSRFWPENEYRPGGPQKSFDKQFLEGLPHRNQMAEKTAATETPGGNHHKNQGKISGGAGKAHRKRLMKYHYLFY